MLNLYSVEDRRFIEVGVQENDAPCAADDCSIDIRQQTDSCFVFDFRCTKVVCSLNVNSAYGPHVTDYGTANGIFDEGNLFMFEEAGDFDPTEALAMMQEPNPEYAAALKTIHPGRYAIYTEVARSRGAKKAYYLRADGRLTPTLTDSCYFDIQIVDRKDETTPQYRLPAWSVVFNPQDGSRSVGFDCPTVEGNTYVPGIGHLRVETATGKSWQDKVFFLGKNGCYAVRSSNLPIENWGEGLYWSVYTPKGSKNPQIDYSTEKSYVWRLKKQVKK